MKILIIGKPTYNVVLPISQYLLEGTKNNIQEKIEMSGGSAVVAATLLSKWQTPVSFSGVVGSDIFGNKIKSDLEAFGVDTKYLEINYEQPTSIKYILLNKQNGISTRVLVNDPEVNLTKYRYDFVPDYILMDGSDLNGSTAALNNFPKATSILMANFVSNDLYSLSKRCTYVVANSSFAKALTKMDLEFGKNKQIVNFMQKIKDLNKAEYVVTIKEKGVLYTSDNQVKNIPGIKLEKIIDDTNSGSAFFGAFSYGLINNYGIDASVKIANIAAGLSMTKIGYIPELSEVLKLAGLNEVKEDSNTEVTNEL
ncbi:MAG: PfkB family carbohydrate kinase [Bacilli bacterium]|nr:PfkB family carbohydrate kinase [Bacilli bacterium]MDD4795343.1 PfkB family carbohydrate kinase [Bacilli bacterium]